MDDEATPPNYDVARPRYFGLPPSMLVSVGAAVARGAARTRMFAGFALRTARAWAAALRRLVQLRLERRHLDRRRMALQSELGGAALEGDEPLLADLRGRLRACIDDLARNDDDRQAAVDGARDRTSEERSAVARTVIATPDAGSMGDPGLEPGTSALSERRSNQLS